MGKVGKVGNFWGSAMSHDVFRDTEGGFSCRRCSLWARFRALFALLTCPPPDGR